MIKELYLVLLDNILPFWSSDKMIDRKYGGFSGRIDSDNNPVPLADKGAILNARILWSFSAAHRFLSDKSLINKIGLDPDEMNRSKQYRETTKRVAQRAKEYLISNFIDRQNGGVFWSLDYKGNPSNDRKQFYAISFAIYGLSEYYRIDPDPAVLKHAFDLYRVIEDHSFDSTYNGYIEATTRDWRPIEDMRLSDRDENVCKSMNTHIHILEAYTSLYSIMPDDKLKTDLENLILIILDKIKSPTSGHLNLFFDRQWNVSGKTISYGHDIETSWLLMEAALLIGNTTLLERVKRDCFSIAMSSLEGFNEEGYMIYETHPDGTTDNDAHWWVQAECVTGLLYLYKYHNLYDGFSLAKKSWNYIKNNLIDHTNGEWFWSVKPDGSVNREDDKAGFWKCPYHNTRMCINSIELLLK